MVTTSGWRLLTSSLKVRGSPVLLIKHEISTRNNGNVSSLKVCVTDLTYLWMEVVERKDLIIKACKTDIDPSGQFDKVMEYLTKGLNLMPETSLALRSERGRSHLVLHLKSPLPKPLQTFGWDFDLKQASETEFTREFVVPLMASLSEAQSSVMQLQGVIKDKDKAIRKIDLQLQSHNKQLTDLFDKRVYGESCAERHKRKMLENKITGLKQFNEHDWRNSHTDLSEPSIKDLSKMIFEHALTSKANPSSLDQDAWWENLGNGVEVDEPSQISQPALLHRQSTSAFESSQTEASLPNDFRNGHRPNSPIQRNDSNMADVDAHDSDSTASTTSDLETPAPSSTTRRIGKIGGKNNAEATERTVRASSPIQAGIRPSSRSIDIEANEGRPRGKIGKIGGPRTVVDTAGSDTCVSQSDGSPSRTSKVNEDNQSAVGPSRDANFTETTEEQANRRRAELKHDLEEKRKAPVKKKRRF